MNLKNQTSKAPTQAETIALQYFWEQGAATVPELHEHICQSADVGYTTVLKRIQRMEEKGLVKRVAALGRAHRYQAVLQPKRTRKTLVKRLIENAFDNSTNALIQHAIDEHKLSADDIVEIRDLLDRVEASKAHKN